jgi:uncharacterized protein YcgL (UPF0745 family)
MRERRCPRTISERFGEPRLTDVSLILAMAGKLALIANPTDKVKENVLKYPVDFFILLLSNCSACSNFSE